MHIWDMTKLGREISSHLKQLIISYARIMKQYCIINNQVIYIYIYARSHYNYLFPLNFHTSQNLTVHGKTVINR